MQRKKRKAAPEPEPSLVTTNRVTVIDVDDPFPAPEPAKKWLAGADEDDLEASLAVLNRVVHVYRLVTADPHVAPLGRHGSLVARVGYGIGDQVSEGLWSDCVELSEKLGRQSRAKVLTPQAHLAAVLSGKERRLICEELALRARLDLDSGRTQEASLQVLIAVDAAIAEVSVMPHADRIQKRLEAMSALRDELTDIGQRALEGPLGEDDVTFIAEALRQVEALLRARAVLSA